MASGPLEKRMPVHSTAQRKRRALSDFLRRKAVVISKVKSVCRCIERVSDGIVDGSPCRLAVDGAADNVLPPRSNHTDLYIKLWSAQGEDVPQYEGKEAGSGSGSKAVRTCGLLVHIRR